MFKANVVESRSYALEEFESLQPVPAVDRAPNATLLNQEVEARASVRQEDPTCQRIVRGLRVALGLAIFAVVGSTPQPGLDVLLDQIRTMGPRQWLGVMAASTVPVAFVKPQLAGSLARLLPARVFADPETRGGSSENRPVNI
jgi:hypothetical protein